ncbi:MAG: redox-regulated ATPase YchF, partial [Gammaproteobacteria bacterium]|nr:redox-regulated ATPase YchF [Gammaproteobacteria bacterium]
VPDPRLDRVAEIAKQERVVPSAMEFVDIAGLVAGAANGEGLGNQFLAHIRETDAVAHVVRCFEDENVAHVTGSVDPGGDIDIIDLELALADLETAERVYDRNRRIANAGDKDARRLVAVLDRVRSGLEAGKPVRAMGLADHELGLLRECHFITQKPVMYVANVAEDGFEDNPMLNAVATRAALEGAAVVPVCAKIEAEISELDAADRAEFLDDLGLDEPGLDRVVRAGYRLLGLHHYFTAGPKEARAWTVPAGTLAPQAAGVIHTDFERGFIRAEVVSYDDYVAHGGENGAREAGRRRLEGRDYVVRDGDVIHFRFNV